jgi:hypothetical protein
MLLNGGSFIRLHYSSVQWFRYSIYVYILVYQLYLLFIAQIYGYLSSQKSSCISPRASGSALTVNIPQFWFPFQLFGWSRFHTFIRMIYKVNLMNHIRIYKYIRNAEKIKLFCLMRRILKLNWIISMQITLFRISFAPNIYVTVTMCQPSSSDNVINESSSDTHGWWTRR